MGEMCRSADMVYLQVLVPQEAAERFAHEISTQDLMMFTDLNENVQMFQRDYIKDITRINETQRALAQIESFFVEYGALTEEDCEVIVEDLQTPREEKLDLFRLADEIQKFYKDLKTQVISSRTLAAQAEHYRDQLEVLRSLDSFLDDAPQFKNNIGSDQMGVPLVNQTDASEVGFKYLAGVCPLVKVSTLRKQIFHITRGNRYFRSETLEGEQKAAFVVFFIGDYARNMIKKFCDWMDVRVYMDSTEGVDQENLAAEVEQKISDHQETLKHTDNELKRTMESHRREIRKWNIQLKQEMAIRVLLNKFKLRKNVSLLRAEGWCAAANKEAVEQCLQRSQTELKKAGMVEEIRGRGVKPTYFETNTFTNIFQVLIDTYGVPRNGEFNPAVPSIVTFPFLFAMMYGDIFHGSFLFLGGALLIFYEKENAASRNEFIGNIHSGRYLIFLMGAFAIYNGLIYNDCTSISINGFNGSQWEEVDVPCLPPNQSKTCTVPNGRNKGVYAFGIDPVWAVSEVQLQYTNSLKMKLSVLVGITQMTYGLFLKLSNHLNERDYLSIVGEFIPQLIFMMGFFNYMQFIIIFKWCKNWVDMDRPAPGLITLLVDMVLKPGTISDENQLFDNGDLQATIQVVFLLAMFISVPWMLLMKPLVLRSRMNAAAALGGHGHDEQNLVEQDDHHGGHGHGHEDEDFATIMIEQVIHTIEYVLGTISNTASYLRLWALSLAHAQLAEVFYEKTILTGMKSGNGFMVFVTCAMFFGMTIAVLLMMDVLECFLHALRLHWVEFQNKFYYADGIPFAPFSYAQFLGE